VRTLRYHVRTWGSPAPGRPPLVLLHGWMDVGASFQFLVDALAVPRWVIAPDWRGFGLSQRNGTDTYWFPDYVADLDAILRHYSPDEPVNLLGHSMGGNIVGLYAGARPARIRRLINLEGFGLKSTTPDQAPGRYAKWLDELLEPQEMKGYPDLAAVAARLQKTNPRLRDDRAAFLAQHWSAQDADGQWRILGDPAHKRTSPLLYHVEEVMACWRAITAPVLWVEATHTNMWLWMGPKEEARVEVDRRLGHLANVTAKMIDNAGHMLHHDQPELLASMVEEFLA
jgi:pimeloyl-ACP methyl ester carboxylesterase